MPDFSGFAETADPTGMKVAAAMPMKPAKLPTLPGGSSAAPATRSPTPPPDDEPQQQQAAEPPEAPDRAPPEEPTPPAEMPNLDGSAGQVPLGGLGAAPAGGGAALNSGTTAAPAADVHDAIVQAARAGGINPALALATADRESSFNPNAGGTGTIKGLFQMTGGNRARYGQADDADAAAQADAYVRLTNDNRQTMRDRLGREPTDAETYLGHYWGAGRAATMLGMDPQTPVNLVFTPRELATNPGLARAGTVGAAVGSVTSDMQHRMSRYADTPQSATPGLDPNLTEAQQEATYEAQVPPVLKGQGFRPGKDWDAAVASMPESEHVQDRRDETPSYRKLREAKAHLEADTNPGLTPNQRTTADFSQFGGRLAEDAGINSIVARSDQPRTNPVDQRRGPQS